MENIVIIFVLVAVIGLSITYIIKAKKSGKKCIGCPSSQECSHCTCGCHDLDNLEK